MCACETCQTMNDLHTAYIAKRRKVVSRVEAQLDECRIDFVPNESSLY
jgi:hypothetical protein